VRQVGHWQENILNFDYMSTRSKAQDRVEQFLQIFECGDI